MRFNFAIKQSQKSKNSSVIRQPLRKPHNSNKKMGITPEIVFGQESGTTVPVQKTTTAKKRKNQVLSLSLIKSNLKKCNNYKPVAKAPVNPVIKPAEKAPVNPKVKPVMKPLVNPVMKPLVNAPVKPVMKPTVNPPVKPVMNPLIDLPMKPPVKPPVKSAAKAVKFAPLVDRTRLEQERQRSFGKLMDKMEAFYQLPAPLSPIRERKEKPKAFDFSVYEIDSSFLSKVSSDNARPSLKMKFKRVSTCMMEVEPVPDMERLIDDRLRMMIDNFANNVETVVNEIEKEKRMSVGY
jgi:hypothetical protein